jgi:hypothetical protein
MLLRGRIQRGSAQPGQGEQMVKAIHGLTVIASFALISTLQPEPVSAQPMCGYYAIGGCFKQQWQADDRAAQLIDAYTVRTNNISNFAPGWWCAVDGPYQAKNGADAAKRKFVRKGVNDAYVKKGGC